MRKWKHICSWPNNVCLMNCPRTCLYAAGVGWGYEWGCSMISVKLSARTEQQLVSQCLTHHHNSPCDWHTMQDTLTNLSFFLCRLSLLSPYQFWFFLKFCWHKLYRTVEFFWAAKHLSKSTIKFYDKIIFSSLFPLICMSLFLPSIFHFLFFSLSYLSFFSVKSMHHLWGFH